MSLEIFVLSDHKLPSIDAWQEALTAESMPLRLDTTRPFDTIKGYLPAFRGEQLAGFECDHWTVEDVIDGSPDIDFGRHWKEALAFRFGGDNFALWGAFAAATAYARATGGVVFDGESGDVLSPDRAAELTRQFERGL